MFNTASANAFGATSSNLIAREANSQNLNDYIPPNNGGPDSQHGSGTR